MIRVLLAEDDINLRSLICKYLNREGYRTTEVLDGKEAVNEFSDNKFDLVVLDMMLPKMSGIEVCANIKQNSNVPIIMINAKDMEYDELIDSKCGANEYIKKPFSIEVFLSKVNALLKKTNISNKSELVVGDVRVAYGEHCVYYKKERVNLTPKEYDLVCYFLENVGQILSRDQILQLVWGIEYDGDVRTVDTHVKCLRYKIPVIQKKLMTVRKVGYVLDMQK